jgi:hypothetical protein
LPCRCFSQAIHSDLTALLLKIVGKKKKHYNKKSDMEDLSKETPFNKADDEQLKVERINELILLKIKKRKQENEVLKKLLDNLNANNTKQNK